MLLLITNHVSNPISAYHSYGPIMIVGEGLITCVRDRKRKPIISILKTKVAKLVGMHMVIDVIFLFNNVSIQSALNTIRYSLYPAVKVQHSLCRNEPRYKITLKAKIYYWAKSYCHGLAPGDSYLATIYDGGVNSFLNAKMQEWIPDGDHVSFHNRKN